MTLDEQRGLVQGIILGGLAATAFTSILVKRQDRKIFKKVKTVLDSQHELIQWTANHSLDLDREEFARQFTIKALFLNIVVQES
jgi:hypothetical protein